nr:immunoglobulin heavy chain junction region [Macaca mulatta]
CAKKDDSLDVW